VKAATTMTPARDWLTLARHDGSPPEHGAGPADRPSMSEALHTLAGPCRHLEEIRKSRFLVQAIPVDEGGQALAFFQAAGDPAATHNCWAWRIGQDYRFNDDGEPGGTAGRPILQAIDGQGMDRVAVLVTRWFGGVKLGTGGLVRAYGGSAAECLRRAERRPLIAMARLAFACGFAELALFKARLKELDAELVQEDFGAGGASLAFRLPAARADEARARVADLSRGRIEAKVEGPGVRGE
jgi:uncharacterized YigZ family protein